MLTSFRLLYTYVHSPRSNGSHRLLVGEFCALAPSQKFELGLPKVHAGTVQLFAVFVVGSMEYLFNKYSRGKLGLYLAQSVVW